MYLGIDIGTSGVKALLLGEDGAIAGQAVAPLTVSRPHPLWSEQAPADWWRAVEQAVADLDAGLRRKVRGIGLSGQMHGAVALGADDGVLRPAILWNDGRSQPQCAELTRIEPRTPQITGNAVLAGFTAPKLLWLRENEPDLFAAIRTLLLPKDWVRLRMTGEKISDMSDASGTLWLDVAKRRWSPAMLAACGLDEAMMPALCEGSAASATLSAEVAARWGMEPVPVAGGGGDNAAGAVGLGVVDPGQTFLSLGTSGVIFTVTEGFRPDPDAAVHAFAHAVPDRWHRMSVMLSAASCLDWGVALTGLRDVPALLELSLKADERSDLLFLPYLSGERTPHANPAAQGVFFGLTGATGQAELARAVLEGVAMGLRDGLDALTDATTPIEEISMAGGGSRSDAWGRVIAAALERPLLWREGGDIGPALGAARLGRLAAGDGGIAEVCTPPAMTARVDPDPALVERMREKQGRFRALYAAVDGLWPGVA
ncbi:xylulokinase [Sphingomonas abietis]|uniref:Xylulose kinase n=1 Tax=Sphingomonas abietis TaxID=3012344 RepID=A0ABY7NL05_9SPHN|nr:xylulokinase [Sphingomonas abietis]WBO22225.1 xylulokinase [Sphingomonas abietis]